MRYLLLQFPIRVARLIKHFAYPISKRYCNAFPPKDGLQWLGDLTFYIMDVIAIPEMYQFLLRCIKWNTRKLNEEELAIGKSVFGETLRYDLIRIDDKARFGTKKIALAYVSFNTINYIRKIKSEIFVHELVHVWQFQYFGSIYIARAIEAQRSKEGYDYGGTPHLYKVMLNQGKLTDFNFEQQADIIEDYYKAMKNKDKSGPLTLNIYTYFAEQLHREDSY
ncbi:MAG: hypothetical protein WBO36_06420 [Saprospiraceae bacterium]